MEGIAEPDILSIHVNMRITHSIDIPSIDVYAVKFEKLCGKVVVPKTAVTGV